jgi:Tfp pilus assembly protein PilN
MIRINLMPERDVRRRRTRARAAPTRQVSPLTILAIAALVVVAAGYYYTQIYRPINQLEREKESKANKLAKVNRDIEALEPKVETLKEAALITDALLKVVYALDPVDRLLWSRKLNQVSDLVPDNVYIVRIGVTEDIKRQEAKSSKQRVDDWEAAQKKGRKKRGRAKAKTKAGPKPESIYFPVITQTLRLTGVAYSDNPDDLIPLINQFYKNLKEGSNAQTGVRHEFMRGFRPTIDYGSFIPQKLGGRQVLRFDFTLTTVPTNPEPEMPGGT